MLKWISDRLPMEHFYGTINTESIACIRCYVVL